MTRTTFLTQEEMDKFAKWCLEHADLNEGLMHQLEKLGAAGHLAKMSKSIETSSLKVVARMLQNTETTEIKS